MKIIIIRIGGELCEKIKKYISDSIGTGAADHRILQHCRYQRKRIQSDPTVR